MITNLKDLERFFKLCRKQGVTEANLQNLTFKFGDLPNEKASDSASDINEDPYSNFPTGELTPEQLMFYSSGGIPENDPALKVG